MFKSAGARKPRELESYLDLLADIIEGLDGLADVPVSCSPADAVAVLSKLLNRLTEFKVCLRKGVSKWASNMRR